MRIYSRWRLFPCEHGCRPPWPCNRHRFGNLEEHGGCAFRQTYCMGPAVLDRRRAMKEVPTAKLSLRFTLATCVLLLAAVQTWSSISLLDPVLEEHYIGSASAPPLPYDITASDSAAPPPLTAENSLTANAAIHPQLKGSRLESNSLPPPAAAIMDPRMLPAGDVRVYIVDLSDILGNNSAAQVLSRLARRGHNATTRTIAHVTSSDYAAQKHQPRPSGDGTPPTASMKCDYHDESCSLRAYMHEEVLLDQLAQSSHVTDDAATADFLIVPLPSTLLYFYLRDVTKHACPECEQLERRISHHLSGGGAGEEVARRWRRCGGNDFVFMSLRCPDAHGRPMNNRGWESMFGPFKEPVRGVHICLEPSEEGRIPYARRARLRRQRESEPAASMAFHTLIAPFYEWDATLTLSAQQQVQGARTLRDGAMQGGGATRRDGDVLSVDGLRPSRPTSVYFKGSAINGLRSSLFGALQPRNCKSCVGKTLASSRFVVTGTAEHLAAMAKARYCVAPRGEAASAKRVFDSVASGCIPVILADEYIWPFAGPLSGQLTPSDFSLHVREREAVWNASRLIHLLERVPERRTRALQLGLEATWRRFRYGERYVRGEALDGIVAELAHRREALMDAGCRATLTDSLPLSASATSAASAASFTGSATSSSSASDSARSAQPPTGQPTAREAEHARFLSMLTSQVRVSFDAKLREASKAGVAAGAAAGAAADGEAHALVPMSLDELEAWSNQGDYKTRVL